MRDGPTEIKSYICNGCKYLQQTRWEDYGENDYYESGTQSVCTLKGILVSMYDQTAKTPKECPYVRHE